MLQLGMLPIDSASASILDKSGLNYIQDVGPDRIGQLHITQKDLADRIKEQFNISFTSN